MSRIKRVVHAAGSNLQALVNRRGRTRLRPDRDVGWLMDLSDCSDEPRYRLRAGIRVGRDPKANDIVIPRDTVSATHGVILLREGRYYIRDLRSGNGTWINGNPVKP
ncbi:MAG TPA: FHA domain-containing protein, partial [Candidatus Methylomirabilis sp.]